MDQVSKEQVEVVEQVVEEQVALVALDLLEHLLGDLEDLQGQLDWEVEEL